MVSIASSAANYNPVFYWLIGAPARFFSGVTSFEAMRLVAGLLCSALLGLAGYAAALWAETSWPLIGMVTALTPMVTFSTALCAPNGIEMIGGLGLIVALIGLRITEDIEVPPKLLALATVFSVPLITVRTLGPLWFFLIIATVGALGWLPSLVHALCHHRTLASVCAVVLVGTGTWALWWTFAARMSVTNSQLHFTGSALPHAIPFLVLWVFQSIGVFPDRVTTAPALTYMIQFLLFGTLVGIGIANGARRLRLVLVGGFTMCFAAPLVLTLAMFSRLAYQWQERYALPFAVCLVVLASIPMEQDRISIQPILLWSGLAATATAQIASVVSLDIHERASNSLAGGPLWWAPTSVQSGIPVALGFAAWACAFFATSRRPPDETGLRHGRTHH